MFGLRAFRTWVRVVAGAAAVSVVFLAIMILGESVIGSRARVTPAALGLSIAAFVGYIVVAGYLRRVAGQSSERA